MSATTVEAGVQRSREVLALVHDLCVQRLAADDDAEAWSPLTCAALGRLCDEALADLRGILDHLPGAVLNEVPRPRRRRRVQQALRG